MKSHDTFKHLLITLIICFISLNALAGDSNETTSASPTLSNQRIEINLAARQLRLFENNKLVKTYGVAVGEIKHQSPMGQRLMDHIIWNPWWNPPKQNEWAKAYEPTAPNTPENPMGPVKMDIDDLYFIHGNNDPISIGHAVTHGCIRLSNVAAIEVAHWLQAGSAPHMNQEKLEIAISKNTPDYYVKLEHPVPVDIIYDRVEIGNKKIYIHKDVYERDGEVNKQALIEDELRAVGIPDKKIRKQLLKRDLKLMKSRDELALEFSKYVKSYDPEAIRSVAQAF